ncbi:MAG: mannose-1-phosphate guanylyltransferase [Armatimonadetes bacterium]|nr:mannose-1-phosphate guanylyltransferase [Armatimonadota bacterium]
MRHAVIMAGGSGTRLWPMSRRGTPKQLIPFLDGRSLLQMAWERLEGLIDPDCICVCASEAHREPILAALPDLRTDRYFGETEGRDTLSAVGLSAALIARLDPDAVFAAVTSDHIIGPADAFRGYLDQGFGLVERDPKAMGTFGITPTAASTGFGYLELGDAAQDGAVTVVRFREKPEAPLAAEYFAAGPSRYLWNSGMFVWNVRTLLDCIERYEPEVHAGLVRIGQAWRAPEWDAVIRSEYPKLRKISVDYAVMERASGDPSLRVLAVPMRLEWMDVGNWASFALTCDQDDDGNRLHAPRAVLQDCRSTLVASTDPAHLVAVVGCEGLMVVHTPDATLICPADQAEAVKGLTSRIMERFGTDAL